MDWVAFYSHSDQDMFGGSVWPQMNSFKQLKSEKISLHQEPRSDSHFGVKRECVLHESLQNFNPVTGFPPDVLHDLLEGIVPFEISLSIKKMIQLKYLNPKIRSFPYQHTDKVDRPQPIPTSLREQLEA